MHKKIENERDTGAVYGLYSRDPSIQINLAHITTGRKKDLFT